MGETNLSMDNRWEFPPWELYWRWQAPCSCTAPAAKGILQELMQLERSINSLDIYQPSRAGCHKMFPHKHYSCLYYGAAPGNISGSLKERESHTQKSTTTKKHNCTAQLPFSCVVPTRFPLPLEWKSWLCFSKVPLPINQKQSGFSDSGN